jgi:hypothetical protein
MTKKVFNFKHYLKFKKEKYISFLYYGFQIQTVVEPGPSSRSPPSNATLSFGLIFWGMYNPDFLVVKVKKI